MRYDLAVLATCILLTAPAPARAEAPARGHPGPATLCVLLPPPAMDDGLPPAEVVDLPVLPVTAPARPAEGTGLSDYAGAAVPGYKLVLAGGLRRDLVLGADQSPALVKGVLVVPAERTLTLTSGAVLHLQPDPQAAPPDQRNAPDPSRTGVLWLSGRLLADGLAGKGIELAAPGASEGGLFCYGQGLSELRGVKMKNVTVTQAAGTVQWLGCELDDARHYTLAAGTTFLIHCTLRRGGGVLAAYDAGPWALLVSHCVFDGGREGLVFRSDPGRESLLVQHNSFVNMRGPVLRGLPAAGAAPPRRGRATAEVLIGENWYGTTVPDRIDACVVDRRSDPAIRLWVNTRPPAERPYAQVGANVSAAALAQTLKSLELTRARMMDAQAKRK